MFKFAKTIAMAAVAAGMMFGAVSTASAGGPPQGIAVPSQPQIAVPTPQPSGDYRGCWSINQDLYGPYRMTFCLRNVFSQYTVTGGGLNCNGGLNWYVSGGQAVIQLRTSFCGQGTDWSADQLVCAWYVTTSAPAANNDAVIIRAGGPPQGIAVPSQPQIAVPTPVPSGNQIRCTYQPAVAGYQPISVLAYRTSY